MAFRFQTFRRAICFGIALTAAVAMGIGTALSYIFIHQGTLWLLLAVESASLIRSVWSLTRKRLFSSPQTVASETIGLFILFPFQLIVTLLAPGMSARQTVYSNVFMALKVFSLTSGILHLSYTIGLLTISMLTVPAFDADVWMRDIDSSPSPFPLGIISGYLFPCVANFFSRQQSTRSPSFEPPSTPCLPTCSPHCTFHGHRDLSGVPKEAEYERAPSTSSNPPPLKLVSQGKEAQRKPPVLPHTLIRVPNASERRASIYVDLPIS